MTAQGLLQGSEPGAGRREEAPALPVAAIALAAVTVLGLLLRLAELDRIPLDEREATQAIAAWNLLNPQSAPGTTAPASPLLFALQATLFTMFGAAGFTARLPVALIGAMLPLAPLLFRDAIGRERSIAICLALAASPLLLMASRQSEAVVMSLLLLALGLWGVWRHARTGRANHAILASCTLAVLVFLSETGGPLLVLQVVIALLLTSRRRRDGVSLRGVPAHWRSWLRAWPVATALPLALLSVFLIATLFMLHPRGMAAPGDLLHAALAGFVGPLPVSATPAGLLAGAAQTTSLLSQPAAQLLQKLQLVLLFEPFIVMAGIVWLWLKRRSRADDVDRFLTFWLAAALVSLLLWRGAAAAHALWLVMPLAGMAGSLLADLVGPGRRQVFRPAWSNVLIVAICLAALALFSFYGRLYLRNEAASPWLFAMLVVLLPALLLLLLRHQWPELLRGVVWGLAPFMAALSLGGGWSTVVHRAGVADGLWRTSVTAPEVGLLQDSLKDLVFRRHGAFAAAAIEVQSEHRDLLRWLLREHARLQFIGSVREAGEADVLLLPESASPPSGSGSWVGQDFVLFRRDDAAGKRTLVGRYLPGDTPAAAADRLVLWLRANESDDPGPADATELAVP